MTAHVDERIVCDYDFRHPARINRDQLRTLEALHDDFARLLSSSFSSAMRAVVDVNTAFVDQTTYAEFIKSLSNPSCSYQFVLGPTEGQAVVDIAMPLAFAFVDRTFGGKGAAQGVEGRRLTQVEMGAVAQVVKHMVEDLESTWEPILRVEISDICLETNPEFLQITAASEIVILLAFEVRSTNASGLVSLCYPFFTLESILPRLAPHACVRQGPRNREATVRQNRQRLRHTELPLRAELARGTVSVAAARAAQVGDVLVCDTGVDEPAVVYVGQLPKFAGLPFVGRAGRRTVKISQVLDAEAAAGRRDPSRPVASARSGDAAG